MPARTTRPTRCGFTIVELLVVVAIIGVLVALLLPAVQAAREAARNAQCKSHLRQVAVAALHYESAHARFPAGGWSARWIGDPNQGTGARQPGGWIYQAAPYLEERPLDGIAVGLTGDALKAALTELAAQPIAVLHCPSRRSSKVYQAVEYSPANFNRIDRAAKTDYAANAGARLTVRGRAFGPRPHPLFFVHSDCWRGYPDCDWARDDTWLSKSWNGIVGDHTGARIAQITDGASHTLLAAEKWLYEIYYETVSIDAPHDNQTNQSAADNPGDDSSLYIGFAYDNVRVVAESSTRAAPPRRDSEYVYYHAQQDKKGKHYQHCFGGPHPAGINAARCDGSVGSVTFDVDPGVWISLGSRNDGGLE